VPLCHRNCIFGPLLFPRQCSPHKRRRLTSSSIYLLGSRSAARRRCSWRRLWIKALRYLHSRVRGATRYETTRHCKKRHITNEHVLFFLFLLFFRRMQQVQGAFTLEEPPRPENAVQSSGRPVGALGVRFLADAADFIKPGLLPSIAGEAESPATRTLDLGRTSRRSQRQSWTARHQGVRKIHHDVGDVDPRRHVTRTTRKAQVGSPAQPALVSKDVPGFEVTPNYLWTDRGLYASSRGVSASGAHHS